MAVSTATLSAAFLAAAIAAVPLTAARAAPPQHSAPVQRAPVFRPAANFRQPQRVVTQRPVRNFTPRGNQTHVNQVHVNRHTPRFTQTPTGGRHERHTGNQNQNQNLQQHNPNLRPNNTNLRPNPSNLTPGPAGGRLTAQTLLKAGPGKINASLKPGHGPIKPAFPVVTMHNKFWPILKGPKFMWFAGHRHFFVPLGVLGVVLIGDSYWYPDGYVSIAGPLCTGFTPDGCQLEWRMVDFEDGGSAAQCVQYCPQAGPPPARVVSLPPPPVLAQSGSCQLTIYADPNFGGLSAPTADNQPMLSETGWKDEIASIQVQAGTWDFFTAENFGGESIRMSAGSYPTLAPEWNKRIESFMCVEPGAGGT
jgi:hypothetical protein